MSTDVTQLKNLLALYDENVIAAALEDLGNEAVAEQIVDYDEVEGEDFVFPDLDQLD